MAFFYETALEITIVLAINFEVYSTGGDNLDEIVGRRMTEAFLVLLVIFLC